MKKFRCTVTRVDGYEIEFDEKVINQEWLDKFAEHMYEFDTLEEHAEHLAQYRARTSNRFIDGYGVIKVNGKIPFPYNTKDFNTYYKEMGININIISEDEACDVEIEEID